MAVGLPLNGCGKSIQDIVRVAEAVGYGTVSLIREEREAYIIIFDLM